MTTIDQAQPGMSTEPPHSAVNPLNSLMARAFTINWEVAFYIVLLVLAVLTRFVNLGDRVMSHDESLHVKYSEELWRNGTFLHTPLMHGPVLFHMTALSYFLFGDSDFTGRLYPAILGIIMIFMPKLLFERWLGKLGAAATSVLILISPMLLYHHRYIREDTPAIFYSILMVYAIFAYLDGVRPRQPWHLVLFSAATLLNLASKETAFMYILVFGFVLTVFLLFQLAQGWRERRFSPVIGSAILGLVIVPLSGVIASLVIGSIRMSSADPAGATTLNNFDDLRNGTVQMLALGVPLAVVIAGAMFVVARLAWSVINKAGERLINWAGGEAHSLFRLLLAGLIIGTVAALSMTVILSIIQPEKIETSRQTWASYDLAKAQPVRPGQPEVVAPSEPRPEDMQLRLITWTGAVVLVLVGAGLLTAVYQFRRLPRLPWRDIILVAVVAVLFATMLVFFEERSRKVPNVSSEARPTVTDYTNEWIEGAWVVGVVSILGIAYLRLRTSFFEEIRQYPAFDLALVLGSLVLPWTGAFAIFLAGYQLDLSSYPQDLILVMIVGEIPFVATAIALGLAWNWQVWLVCAAVFYSLFAFFFTTIFTNVQGIGTGLVGSLGYWLAQQGVRRGSQPQYYYLLIQMPIYEYLAMIGAGLAGMVGLSQLWRFRAGRVTEQIRREQIEAEAALASAASDGTGSEQADATPVAETAMEQPYDPAQTVVSAAKATDVLELDAVNAETPPTETLPAETPPEMADEDKPKRGALPVEDAERLERIPFMSFVGFWALMITLALTMAGEKMPWLTTHISLPLLFATGWVLGLVLERIDWQAFFKQTWAIILLAPLLLIGAWNVVSGVLFGKVSFSGLQRGQLLELFTWFGAILLTATIGYAVAQVVRRTSLTQVVRVGILGVFVLLGVLTARTAWNAAYINYDLATEFLVYAHGAPANKTIINYLEDISRRTTDGMNIRVAYDNQMSWPGSWYFRNFPNAIFLGDTTGFSNPEQYVAIAVGTENANKVEPQLGDQFEKFDLIRLWWPMQDYFDLNLARVDNALGNPQMREGLWDIWWNRDYKTYATATGSADRFDINQWPVVDRMIFYVRKDVASQLWDFGVGAKVGANLPTDPFSNLRCDTCGASLVFDNVGQTLNFPRGAAVGPNGDVYVTDSRNGRLMVFDKNGTFKRSIGVPSPVDQNVIAEPGSFRDPQGIAVDKEGLIYVADTWNHRIQVLQSDGTPLRAWGTFEIADPNVPGKTDGFYGPRDIKLDANGNVYVADTGNRRVRVYSNRGDFLYDIRLPAEQAASMKEPVGLAINDAAGEIYVASTWSKKIVVFSLQGRFLREWTLRAWAATTESRDTGNRPYLALDTTGRYLFVTDPDVGRVLVYDTIGTAVVSFGKLGAVPYTNSTFGVLGGIASDPASGAVYLIDSGGGRVLRFDPAVLPGLMLAPEPVVAPNSNTGSSEATTAEAAQPTAEATLEPTTVTQ